MTQIHSQDAPFRPDVKKPDAGKKEQNDNRDGTFALDADDPTRVENRGGFEAIIDGDADHNDPRTQSEYSSDSGFREDSADALATSDEDRSRSVGVNSASGIIDDLEAEMDGRIEEEKREHDAYSQQSEGSKD